MRFELISNSHDVIVGMRLAGIIGTLVRTAKEAKKTLSEAINKQDVAIVLINESLAEEIPEVVSESKKNIVKPLIVVVPDGKTIDKPRRPITKYIEEAIGLKI